LFRAALLALRSSLDRGSWLVWWGGAGGEFDSFGPFGACLAGRAPCSRHRREMLRSEPAVITNPAVPTNGPASILQCFGKAACTTHRHACRSWSLSGGSRRHTAEGERCGGAKHAIVELPAWSVGIRLGILRGRGGVPGSEARSSGKTCTTTKGWGRDDELFAGPAVGFGPLGPLLGVTRPPWPSTATVKRFHRGRWRPLVGGDRLSAPHRPGRGGQKEVY